MISLINANTLTIPLADKSVQMVATSPPYWGLRDYGTAKWEGGDPECDHKVGRFEYPASDKQKSNNGSAGHQAKNTCPKCGAIRIDNQLGLEKLHDCLGWATGNPCGECYVCHTVAWAREVKRVLRDDGVFFLNLGDSFATSQAGNKTWGNGVGTNKHYENGDTGLPKRVIPAGIKPKDLVGIPWRVALALQADGWYLRSDIIWAKPNPMPESVTDRPTKAHEYVFLLTKSQRYYWDQEAVREDCITGNGASMGIAKGKRFGGDAQATASVSGFGTRELFNNPAGRNIRTVWQIATAPYKGAHFATWPEKLVEPMIKAGSREDDIVLDPFAGSGTTLLVARKLGRSGIGLDLSFAYLSEQATKRLELDKLKKWAGV